MKKPGLLIVNNNMHIGGVQKALVDLIHRIKNNYDITLLLFYAQGELMKNLPEGVRVLETKGHFRYLGMSRKECVSPKDKFFRFVYASVARVFGAKYAVRLIRLFGKKDRLGEFDAVISYLHCPEPKSFYGGTAEYALSYRGGKKKICYVHCDYKNSGTACAYSNKLYSRFDKIACVSESVKNRFLSVLPLGEEKVCAVKNPINAAEVRRLSGIDTYEYDKNYINLLSVARLSDEKGVDRFVRVMAKLNRDDVRYYVVGDGRCRAQIEAEIEKENLGGKVMLIGQDANPYRYMVNADMLIVTSYHEAAPVVFQEAAVLGLKVFSTRTTSADEMLMGGFGFVCDNDEEAITEGIKNILEGGLYRKNNAAPERNEDDDFDKIFRNMIGQA